MPSPEDELTPILRRNPKSCYEVVMPIRGKRIKKPSVEIIRHYDCEHYGRCLSHIAKLDKLFTCLYCEHYEKVPILNELLRNTAR